MKTTIAFILAISALQLSAQTVLPTEYHLLEYDNTTQLWDTVQRVELEYRNGTEWISRETKYNYNGNGNWEDPWHILYEYNSDGMLTKNRFEEYNGTYWQVIREEEWTFDSLGAQTSELRKLWNGISLNTISNQRYIHFYNGFGEIDSTIQEFLPASTTQWIESERTYYTYNGNQEWDSQTIIYTWNGAWDTLSYKRDYIWFNFEKRQFSSFVEPAYQNGQVYATHKWARNWLANDGYDEFSMYLNPNTQNWDSTWRKRFSYNANGHNILKNYYDYVLPSGTWELSQASSQFDHVYNADGSLAQTTENRYVSLSMTYEPRFKWIYSNYITDVEAPSPQLAKLTWAPHPAGANSQLVLRLEKPSQGQLNVYDLHGKLLRQYPIQHAGGETKRRIELELPQGIYGYRLTLGEQIASGKLVVQ